MSETVTLELPEQIARQAHIIADRTARTVEDVLVEWLDYGASETPLESLDDTELLAIAHSELDDNLQQELSILLAGNREEQLTEQERVRLDHLMQIYRQGLVRKARATRVAVDRDLMPRLTQ